MFKKIALVAMLAAGSLQAAKQTSWTDSIKSLGSNVKDATLSKYCLNADREMSKDMTKENAAAVTLNTVNAVSRIALLTQVIRAAKAAIKAEKGEKVDAAKEVLNTKVTKAAAAAAVLAVLCPSVYNWAATLIPEKKQA